MSNIGSKGGDGDGPSNSNINSNSASTTLGQPLLTFRGKSSFHRNITRKVRVDVPTFNEIEDVEQGENPKTKLVDFTPHFCAVCCKKNALLCEGCYSIAYCGKEHKMYHWRDHKEYCKPTCSVYTENDTSKKLLAAERDIRPGEGVLHFQPIMMGPSDKGLELPPDSTICLGCCKFMQLSQGYRCSCCHWPTCHMECEMDPLHAKNECRIFKTNGIRPHSNKTLPNSYEIILNLRCLLLKVNNEVAWKKLVKMKDCIEPYPKLEYQEQRINTIVQFLVNNCHLDTFLEMDFSDIRKLVRVILSSSFTLDNRTICFRGKESKEYISASYVHPIKMYTYAQCTPTANWTIFHGTTKKLEHCFVSFSAATFISEGQLISVDYSRSNEIGSFLRRHHKKMEAIVCNCARCVDPTEYDSFLSAVRCSICMDETKGFLLPIDPKNPTTDWCCCYELCQYKMMNSDVMLTLRGVQASITKLEDDFEGLWNFIIIAERKILHPNNFLLLSAAKMCLRIFYGCVLKTKLNSVTHEIIKRARLLIRKTLKLYDLISPGCSIERGRMLFLLQMNMCIELAKNLYDALIQNLDCDKSEFYTVNFDEVRKIQEEAMDILKSEPYGTPEFKMRKLIYGVKFDQDSILSNQLYDHPLNISTIKRLVCVYEQFCETKYMNIASETFISNDLLLPDFGDIHF